MSMPVAPLPRHVQRNWSFSWLQKGTNSKINPILVFCLSTASFHGQLYERSLSTSNSNYFFLPIKDMVNRLGKALQTNHPRWIAVFGLDETSFSIQEPPPIAEASDMSKVVAHYK